MFTDFGRHGVGTDSLQVTTGLVIASCGVSNLQETLGAKLLDSLGLCGLADLDIQGPLSLRV